MSLQRLRKKIDLLDKKIISLLNLRAQATKGIGRSKSSMVNMSMCRRGRCRF